MLLFRCVCAHIISQNSLHLNLFDFYPMCQKKPCFLKTNYVQTKKKKNHKIIFLAIISFTPNRFKALANQTFAEHSPWICQASVLTSQINFSVIKLFTQVYWLYYCPWITSTCLLPGRRETQLLEATMLPDGKTIYIWQ